MSSDKSTWWSVTAFNGEIELLEKGEFPDYIQKVYGGKEECPDTKKIHFQGAVQCRRQVRLTQLKKWLPTAHFEIAHNKDALKKYAMKEETAIGPKTERQNEIPLITVERILYKLAEVWDADLYLKYVEEDPKDAFKSAYWSTVREILSDFPEYRKVCHIFARADVITLWDRTRGVWLNLSQEEANSITASPPDILPGSEVFSNDLVSNAQVFPSQSCSPPTPKGTKSAHDSCQ